MKLRPLPSLQAILLAFFATCAFANPRAGFFLPDSISEMTMKFRSIRNLIILPVILNDSVKVNLILDTGCRNLVLFGKKFRKLLRDDMEREVVFSGLGSGKPVKGTLSINNEVSIGSVTGSQVPVVIVPERNLFGQYNDIHGIIGYDIFFKFEIEINPRLQEITFRPAYHLSPPPGFSTVPLSIVDSRPLMRSAIFIDGRATADCDLMIDTGSSLGLLLKTTDVSKFRAALEQTIIGRGLNGFLKGYETIARKMELKGYQMNKIPIGIIESEWENHASIGMGILKDYIVVLNYCESYACFRKLDT